MGKNEKGINQALAAAAFGLTLLGGTFYSLYYISSKDFSFKRELLIQVHTKASGIDKLLSQEESVGMARELGYEGVINTSQPITLELQKNTSIGNRFYLKNGQNINAVPLERIEQYISK